MTQRRGNFKRVSTNYSIDEGLDMIVRHIAEGSEIRYASPYVNTSIRQRLENDLGKNKVRDLLSCESLEELEKTLKEENISV